MALREREERRASAREEWARVGFECVQGPGDLLYIPKGFSHATLNFGETLSIALQGAHLDPPR